MVIRCNNLILKYSELKTHNVKINKDTVILIITNIIKLLTEVQAYTIPIQNLASNPKDPLDSSCVI